MGKKAAQVAAFERATLHGLTVYARRRVSFGKQDPERARELFIRGALVDGEFETKLPFLRTTASCSRILNSWSTSRVARMCSSMTN